MVEVNGSTIAVQLPAIVTIAASDAGRIPSPGTLRTLKAQTGKDWDEMMGPDADAADRFQTTIWVKLRRDIPDLRWDDCADVEVEITDAVAVVDPLDSSAPATSPSSAGSGV